MTAMTRPAEVQTRFTWKVDNFSRLNTRKHYSDVFVGGGYKWQVLIFPKGNNVDFLSVYLDVADASSQPYGWKRNAQFSLAVVNQINAKYTIKRDTQHHFKARRSDWGYTYFMPLSELYDQTRGFLVNDTCIIEIGVAVIGINEYWKYDAKKETGYVGLKNQGATAYLNCLLQNLYHIPYFRKAVYHMPTTENDMPSRSIPLALQSLFYKLQYDDTSVATEELTKSFGWGTYDSFMQHDVQELNRVLSEKLEDKMKGTVVEGTIHKLFEGHLMNYIACINVDFKSTRKESFYDLQLDVKGCQNVYASFDKYVEVEPLEGDDKYQAEGHGLQNAMRGVLFNGFPPVLQLQLKRFEYDFMRDTVVKINDRYEFPLQLDLDRENHKYLSPDADRSVRNLYTLHSVLVHSGGAQGGHYYAFIRHTLSDQWFKFDDERVTKEDTNKALEDQYGGEEEFSQINPGVNSTSNAYMLVYIRESDKEKIFCNADEKDVALHLRDRLEKEYSISAHTKESTSPPEKGMGGDKVGPMLTEFDGVDLASEKADILAALKESNPTCLESLHLKTPLVRRPLYDLLAQLLLDLKSLGKESDPSAYAALLPVLLDLETCGFQLAELKAYIELLHQTSEEKVAVIAKREAAEKARQELLAKLQSLDEEIAAMGSLPTAPTSFTF